MNEKQQGKELLKELQQLIQAELGSKPSAKSFQPLTVGLGLNSPQRPEVAAPLPKLTLNDIRTPLFEATLSPKDEAATYPTPKLTFSPVNAVQTQKPILGQHPLQKLFNPPAPKMTLKPIESNSPPPVSVVTVPPPPLSLRSKVPTPPKTLKVTFAQRLFAFVIDQAFVWTVFLFAVVVTLKVLTGQDNFSLPSTSNLQNPTFLRFTVIEFASIWLTYLVVGIGILDMTFGMWVWGLRLRYVDKQPETAFLNKALRVMVSFLFMAPIIPSVLLAFRRRGRNLLDLMTGTALLRST